MIKNIKRIMRDKKMLLLNPLINDNIWVIHDEENVQISRACIIGPSDTPYEHGFYFFEILFPDNYPFEPPKVKFFTNDGRTRMHPNFYSCGKVCVSIIGTWNGPGWTSCQTLTSVLLTFQSLFINNPLHQEPGYENDKSIRNTNYNKIIHHQNLKIAIVQMLDKIPVGFEDFLPVIQQYLVINKKNILKQCDIYHHFDGNKLQSPSIWKFSVQLNYGQLKEKIQNLIDNITKSPYLSLDLEKQILDNINSNTKYQELSENIKKLDIELNEQVIMLLLQLKGKIKINNGEITKNHDIVEVR